MLVIMGVILLLLLSSPVQRAGFAHPVAQLITAASLGAMAIGYLVLNNMIQEAVEG
jgi:Flp pilus assembly protein TadB